MNLAETDDGRRVFAFAPHEDRFCMAPDSLLDVPDFVTDRDAVLYPSVETALQIVHDAHPAFGETVVVCGLGVIGRLVCEILRVSAIDVIAVDAAEERLAGASEIGCRAILAGSTGTAAEILQAAGQDRVDCAINTSGNPEALQLALGTLAMEGTVVEASWYGETPALLNLGAEFHRRRLTIRASQVSHINPSMTARWSRERRTRVAWELVAQLRPSRLISHEIPLESAPEAYRILASRPADLMQIVLVP